MTSMSLVFCLGLEEPGLTDEFGSCSYENCRKMLTGQDSSVSNMWNIWEAAVCEKTWYDDDGEFKI